QPQRIQRARTVADDAIFVDKVVSLVTRLALDPAQATIIVEAVEAALAALVERLVANAGAGLEDALAGMTTWLQPLLDQLEAFGAEPPAIESVEDLFELLATVVAALAGLAENLTIGQLREHAATFLDIIEGSMGLTPAFLEQQIWAVIADVIARVGEMPPDISGEERATRLAVVSLLRRLRRAFYGEFHFPALSADFLAQVLLDLLRRYGLDAFADKASCLAGNVRDFVTAAGALADFTELAPFAPSGPGAARAADPSGDDQYAWYASWLLAGRTRPWYYSFWSWLPAYPADEAWVTADRKQVVLRNVNRDDTVLHEATNLQWKDAPLFASTTADERFTFKFISRDFMEQWAYWSAWSVEPTKVILHFISMLEKGDFVSHLCHTFWNFWNWAYKSPNSGGKPFTSWLNSLFRGPQLTRWWLEPITPLVLTLLASLEGRHTEADEDASAFWFILFAADLFEAITADAIPNAIRDFSLTLFTTLNYDGPVIASPLDDKRPLNREHIDGFIAPHVLLFNWVMVKAIPRERYTYPGDTRRFSDDQNAKMFGEYMFLWTLGFTALGVLSGWLMGAAFARAFDFKLLGTQMLKNYLKNAALFWLTLYSFGEGNTDGEYNPRGDNFAGYPDHEDSPYRLPYEAGKAVMCVQGNQGMWSHNDFGGTCQVYAYDFALDQDEPILAARSGTVVDYFDWVPNDRDEDTDGPTDDLDPDQTQNTSANFVLIRHDDPFDEETDEQHEAHDKGMNGDVVTTYGVYMHGRTGSVREFLQPDGGDPEDIIGLQVRRAQPIMRSGNTGLSFHNHLHIHIEVESPGFTPPASPTDAVARDNLDDIS
ncbi:MAG: M23 family metallopeptidase, partial [Ardenticatenaceae bacterium]